ncbi:uncharacterized protein LOC130014443 [Mercurialis annua]|uniref:uncharacterized protein LOC130014443 n=1 Tax=Mercurialis annua TaxID=3986 RepID=UPI00215ED034|nr:uncharacterized protein LOC130014443 [Mercurialis annua]
MENESLNPDNVRADFIKVLCSRRSAKVPLSVEEGKPVVNPLYQGHGPPPPTEAMEHCPKAELKDFKSLLEEEDLYLITEAGDQGRLPMLILSLKERHYKRPAVVFLHGTHLTKEWLRPMLEAYASRGYVAISIDCRHHGERASSKTTYQKALVSAWKNGDTMPFLFDTVWDLIKLADYLTERQDIDSTRIGITGISLGGMLSWLAAVADTRYAVTVPILGVQGFRWAIDNDEWGSRVDTIRPVFEEAQKDLGKNTVDKEVVEKVWDRIAPGLASKFDLPNTISAIAPRPLLILNGAEDPYCPIAGLEIPKERAQMAYEESHSQDKFKLVAEPGIAHLTTPFMVKEAADWFDKFLK